MIRQHLEATPDDPFLQHALALELIKTGDDAGARTRFEGLLDKDPTYVGSYYHLGKLLERIGDNTGAIAVYERGMTAALAAGDRRALGELRSAHSELTM